jgi:Ion channel
MYLTGRRRFYYLLLALLLTIVISPLLKEFTVLRIVFDVSLSIIFLIGCFTVSQNKYVLWLAVILSVPLLISVWIGHFDISIPIIALIGKVSGVAYFGLIAGTILVFVFTVRKVTWSVISAALIVYLTLGVMWGFAFALVEMLQPTSFSFPDNLLLQGNYDFMYFSFITLTTVGYGDITPVTGIARSLSLLEGILGQSYMAILVARLVGLHVSSSGDE